MGRHFVPELPSGGGETSSLPPLQAPAAGGETPPPSSSAAVGQQDLPHPQYRRLFGTVPPAEAIGIPLPADCDPSLGGECHLSAALIEVGRLRARHFAKGCTPDRDAQRGPVWFWHGIHEFWWRAQDAYRDPVQRRRHKIAAAALLIASIEADEVLLPQQEPSSERQ